MVAKILLVNGASGSKCKSIASDYVLSGGELGAFVTIDAVHGNTKLFWVSPKAF